MGLTYFLVEPLSLIRHDPLEAEFMARLYEDSRQRKHGEFQWIKTY